MYCMCVSFLYCALKRTATRIQLTSKHRVQTKIAAKKGGTKEGFPVQQFDQTLQPIQDVNVLEKMILAQPPNVHFSPPSQTNFSNG